ASLAGSWPLPPQAAASLVRHVPGCPVCRELRTPQVPPAGLLSVLPVAALPAELRLDVLTAATDEDRAGNRRAIAAWTGPFDEYGWPLPYEPAPARARDRPPRRRGPLIGALALAAGVVLLAAGAMAWLGSGGRDRTDGAPPVRPAPADSGEANGSAGPGPRRGHRRRRDRPGRAGRERRADRVGRGGADAARPAPHGHVAVPEPVGDAVADAVADQDVEDAEHAAPAAAAAEQRRAADSEARKPGGGGVPDARPRVVVQRPHHRPGRAGELAGHRDVRRRERQRRGTPGAGRVRGGDRAPHERLLPGRPERLGLVLPRRHGQ